MQRFWGTGRPQAHIQQQAYSQGEGFNCPKVIQALVCGYASCKHKNGRPREEREQPRRSKQRQRGRGGHLHVLIHCKAHQLLRAERTCVRRAQQPAASGQEGRQRRGCTCSSSITASSSRVRKTLVQSTWQPSMKVRGQQHEEAGKEGAHTCLPPKPAGQPAAQAVPWTHSACARHARQPTDEGKREAPLRH